MLEGSSIEFRVSATSWRARSALPRWKTVGLGLTGRNLHSLPQGTVGGSLMSLLEYMKLTLAANKPGEAPSTYASTLLAQGFDLTFRHGAL